ncbi:hypothetical protein OPV22_001059 [Ensete ventricosum]|uniref:HMA domain-containing protein n=1 Tax=Ensete ventricosum TaxID=4639 RepID=A0AAV8RVI2_ENSVE|nr:hypothetical protein OPV22_001059 [Ensete ventricosum]
MEKTYVLKLQTCCVECQKKIKKLIHKIDGVYAVDIDGKEKVTVTGNVDPEVLIRQLQQIGEKAELLATKDENTQPQKEDIKSRAGGSGGTKLPVEEKKTCVLKVRLCCVGCQKKIKKLLLKIDGVHAVDIDGKEKVTVTGNVDPEVLIRQLQQIGEKAELLATKDGNTQPQKEDIKSRAGGSGGTKLPVEEKKTCVLKVRLCCVGCQKKIRKALLKIDGM